MLNVRSIAPRDNFSAKRGASEGDRIGSWLAFVTTTDTGFDA
jgi:hypothetical protein